MDFILNKTIERLNSTRRLSRWASTALIVLRGLILGFLFAGFWASIHPSEAFHQLTLMILTFILCLVLSRKPNLKEITKNNFLISLEMRYSDKKTPAFDLAKTLPFNAAEAEWRPTLKKEEEDFVTFEKKRLLRLASTLVVPLILLLLVGSGAQTTLGLALNGVKNVVASFSRGATMKIISGIAKEGDPTVIQISTSKIARVELLAQNMIEIELRGAASDDLSPKVVELRKHPASKKDASKKDTVFQSFQMHEIKETNDQGETISISYKVAFAVTDDIDLYVPYLSGRDPLAEIFVKQLPVPKVSISASSKLEDPWPDDRPLDLHITVNAQKPLQLVRLIITSGKRISQELVNNILTDEILDLETDYQLILEPYVESDLAEVSVVAEAVDRSLPTPLVGRSKPLILNTASAYGRYRETLQTLREIKTFTDDAIAKKENKLPKDAKEIIKKTLKQSEDSPFFDGLDRIQLMQFETDVGELVAEEDSAKMMELSDQLNNFLFEHEVLDDRDRDRDFFVAVRGLSRLVEQPREKRAVDVSIVTDRIKDFLTARQTRWTARVARIPDGSKPAAWANINANKPFHATMDKIKQLDQTATRESNSQILVSLSKVATDYRVWIEELEAAEDKARAESENKRQQGLVSARNQLVELQKRQGSISQKLDRAETKDTAELSEQWPSARMEQNTNLESTRRLEAQMRSLSPAAGERIKAALESMNYTVKSGNEKKFIQAESGSDLAGRLLRQAESAAQKSQRQGEGRGRRRRVSGDRYYGQSVNGGDIEISRDYQVDKRYREAILDEVRQTLNNSEGSGLEEENRKVLENYLRQVIR